MAHCYNFAIIRFSPDKVRGESLNIGAAVFSDSGIDIRPAKRLERAKVISQALDLDALSDLLNNLKRIDESNLRRGDLSIEQRLDLLSRVGTLSFSRPGTFQAEDAVSYEERIGFILQRFVEPEPGLVRARPKKSKLLTQIRNVFKKQRVLAKKGEDLQSHRIVTGVELDEGLVADLVLRNGSYHVVETVDASGDEHASRKAITEIAISALVLERARMRFGNELTKGRLVYSASSALETVARPSLEAAAHQGAELVNWASEQDRMRFVQALSMLAIPIETKRKQKFFSTPGGNFFQ
ncbi:DUF3037 domain-containing protein [Methylocystis sp. MJC1]|jgi:hypothetical protein|uniref:DUF3037 domain-containing protein n=1 Tax=Methylocystis sp. MJC1 TaxID=2654282 RepID=UPI0013EB1CA8|nr:DUF3037 domain-containing protein [Methylocystis sp. MJC1]KAF2992860.1 hypothetical protein MJC1_00441 [Methylocystis sp. MJC1]MBU6526817.1 DUF3037 domain-containing protein [Methylocystis sp. MJC1]UZX13252.1 DUF3037 domain-containing protein [Methylocystis sp. MJC1]